VSSKSLENIDGVVKDAVRAGAQVLTGGERFKSKGFFYRPTILKNISSKMRVSQEEVFGPVAPISIVENEIEAVNLANDSKFGLGASIWTQDLDKAENLSRLVQSGIVTVNNVVISDPRIPFGGVKNSGFGRELSKYGMIEFVNTKSVRFYDQLVQQHHVE
jgi:succinate-semialdehyde dehydrogenase/glutarate-semialdehyde dehydrogenase/succinyl-CoA reductase